MADNDRRPGDRAANGRRQAYKIVATQLVLTFVIALGFWIGGGRTAALAALYGGLINVLGNMYFVRRLFGAGGARSARHIVRAFYLGEFVKLLLTAALFTLAIAVLRLPFAPLLTAFVATLLVFWLALLPRF